LAALFIGFLPFNIDDKARKLKRENAKVVFV